MYEFDVVMECVMFEVDCVYVGWLVVIYGGLWYDCDVDVVFDQFDDCVEFVEFVGVVYCDVYFVQKVVDLMIVE